jgi:threonyl-tRNA synthetase
LVNELKAGGIRAALYDRETLGYRIRDAERQKVPYMGVVGEREAEAGTVAVRKQGAGKKQEVMSRTSFLEVLRKEVETRALREGAGGSEDD